MLKEKELLNFLFKETIKSLSEEDIRRLEFYKEDPKRRITILRLRFVEITKKYFNKTNLRNRTVYFAMDSVWPLLDSSFERIHNSINSTAFYGSNQFSEIENCFVQFFVDELKKKQTKYFLISTLSLAGFLLCNTLSIFIRMSEKT